MYDVLRDNIGLLEADKDDANDKPSKYNPLYLLGRVGGYITKRADQGFSKEYGGPKHSFVVGYGHDKRYTNPHVEHEAADQSGISLGVGLGKAYDTGNKLYNIDINQYHDSDASFIGDGDDPATSRVNIPAIIAARMAGGSPDPRTIRNGINRRSTAAPIRLGNLRDDFGPNG